MADAIGFLISGMIFGLSAGTSPGPLLALVFSETLKYGKKEGIKIAVSPLITDLPIILFVLFVLSSLARFNLILGAITLFGAGYLIFLGVENLRVRTAKLDVKVAKKGALKRGVVANFLSPHPYLFWLSIGGPMIFKSLDVHVSATVLFILGFYSMLVGSKTVTALVLDRFKHFVKSKKYVYIVRILGVALIAFALVFVNDGLRLLGLL